MIEKLLSHAVDACQRYEKRKRARRTNEQYQDSKDYSKLNYKDRLLNRLIRLGTNESLAKDLIAGKRPLSEVLESRELPATTRLGLERVLGDKDFLPARFLEEGQQVARCVGRLKFRESGRTGFGTGFLIAPSILLTNHHVLDSIQTAKLASVQFNFEANEDDAVEEPIAFKFDTDTFFLTDESLDCTFVMLEDPEGKARHLGYCPLIKSQGKIAIGEHVNIIQHPDGRPKEIAIRDNKLVDLPDGRSDIQDLLYYTTDTEGGSSGSPVFNDEWEVVGLHHRAVPKTKKNRKTKKLEILTKDGQVWEEGMDKSLIQYIANEGVRASSLVRLLEQSALDHADQARIRDAILQVGANAPLPVEKNPDNNPEKGSGLPSKPKTTPDTTRNGSFIELPLIVELQAGKR